MIINCYLNYAIVWHTTLRDNNHKQPIINNTTNKSYLFINKK